ncbi:sterol homeostasis protein [Haplosporangium sp. Z 27]|nr:sterol homeostasis protein [Haplosporangium sp. Z 27]
MGQVGAGDYSDRSKLLTACRGFSIPIHIILMRYSTYQSHEDSDIFFNKIEFLSFHFGVRLIVSLWYGGRYAILKYNYITTTLIISSFGKLLLMLMVIWDYTELEHAWHLVNFVVLSSNIEALSVFLDTGYLPTALVILFGLVCRVLIQFAFASITGDSALVTVASM